MREGAPEIPLISKLIAVPNCDDVIISVTPSNKLEFVNYNVCPFPRYERQEWPDGSHSLVPVFKEDASIYLTDADFPGRYGEIIETGYVRAQKVVRVAIYPIQFNPVRKTLKVFTDFNVNLSFVNPASPVNKELGIFRNMMHHAALNYELSGISASWRGFYLSEGNKLGKISMPTTGTVNGVTNLTLLVGPNAMPVDYLIITHSNILNSVYLTNLANHRKDLNGFDVVIVQVAAPGANNDIYDFYPDPDPNPPVENYVSIRNVVADVYANGKANHTYDDKLGYIVLVGDANFDNTTEMMPASRVYNMGSDPEIPGENLGYGSDYYYACVTQTGGTYDNYQDVMYGRISVDNEGELSNVVNKIIDYEINSSGAWRNNIAFMFFSPWFFHDDAECDLYFKQMAQIVPQSYYLSYAWRGFAKDTEPSLGRPNFLHHPVDQVSQVLVPDEADEMWLRRYTGWRWQEWNGSEWVWMYGGQYADPANLCGSDEIDDWLYDKMNAGLHTFVYEGHGRQASLGAGEGSGRTIFRANDIQAELSNYRMYPFIISNACATGYFDATTADMGSIDCIAEKSVNLQNEGAIGFLGSARTSFTGAFNYVDRYVLEAQFNFLSHVMGEAVMESKLRLWDVLFRRQYNLYGDPAVNLWPYGYTVTEDITLSGQVDITTPVTVAPDVTMTIQPEAVLIFHPGTSLTIKGTLTAQGTSANHVTFTSSNASPQKGDWDWIKFDNSNGTCTPEYCDIKYAKIGVWGIG